METLGHKVEQAMQRAGIKARTFAELVGCHYSTIYYLLRNKESAVPLRIVQEKIHKVIDFIDYSVERGLLPIRDELTVPQKTAAVKRLYEQYGLETDKS